MKKAIFALMCLLPAFTCRARTIIVDANGLGDYPTIQAAIDNSSHGDIIILSPGTYTGSGNRDIDFGGRAITVRSTDPNDPNIVEVTIINCEGSSAERHRGFTFGTGEGSSSILAGVTITNGYTSFGGAISGGNNQPTIIHCVFTNNVAHEEGGAMYRVNGKVTHCTIVSNRSNYYGGALSRCNGEFENCIIIDNQSGYHGGGMYECDGTFRSCLVVNNHGRYFGGGFFECDGPILGCTIVANGVRWHDDGGGLARCNGPIANCIVWNNSPDDIYQCSTPTYSCWPRGTNGDGNIDLDPCFVDPGAINYRLQALSPCINSGDPDYVAAEGETDIDGQPRIISDRIDIGAYEAPLAEKPVFELGANEFEFIGHYGGNNPAAKILTIRNRAQGILHWQITHDCEWLEVTPSSGSSAGEINEVALSVELANLPIGNYNCELTISDPNADNSPQTVRVRLLVWPVNVNPNWPMYQYNAAHTGYIPIFLNPNDFVFQWERTIGSIKSLNPVIAADGKVFASLSLGVNDDGISLFTLDATTGDTLWSKDFGRVHSVNPPSYGYGTVYIQTGGHPISGNNPNLRAYDAETGELVFKSQFSAQQTEYLAPTIFDGIVYIGGGHYGGMYAFNAHDGSQIWFEGLNMYDRWTPAVDNSYAYAYVGHGSTNRTPPASLSIINRLTGQEAFVITDTEFDWHGYSMNMAPVIGSENNVLVTQHGHWYGRLISFDLDSQDISWVLRSGFTGQISLAQGIIYVINDGILEARDETTGDLLWTWAAPGEDLRGQIVLTNMHALVSTSSTTYAINLVSHESEWSYPAGGNLCIGDGHLYIARSRSLTAINIALAAQPTLIGLGIKGPNEVAENSQAKYKAIAYYDNGFAKLVTASAIWAVSPEAISGIDPNGLLQTDRIVTPTNITISAEYTEDGNTVDATKSVQVSELVGLEVTGPNEVRENFHAKYKVTAEYVNGVTNDVTESTFWQVEPPVFATIDADGLLHTKDITEPVTIRVYATYTAAGITLEDSMLIDISLTYTRLVPYEYETIQSAIDDCNEGDQVVIAQGIYMGAGNRDLDFGGKAIIAQSTNPECPAVVASTIIDCNGTEADPHRAFYFHSGEDGNSIVAGFTIKNGYADDGAGVYCVDSSPVITNCNFINGSAENWGGGICCYKSSPLISDCTFTGNSAFEGGAITTRSYWNYLCSPHIENCRIFANTASGSGGGINSDCLSTPTISNCTISGNFAGTYGGGGISIFQSNPTIINCLITHNSSDNSGGGILHWYEFENGSTITNCTIASNSADEAGGIFCSSEMTVTNSILWDNSHQQIIDQGTVSVIYSNVQGDWLGIGNLDNDPCFVQLGYWDANSVWVEGDYHLLEGSPCINTGDPHYVAEPNETDLDGRPRILLGRIDMGAYEFNHLPVADAGPNQTAYAWIDGIAEVTLDGSDSNDPDGDELTYLWTWTIEPNTYEANGVTPTIELPVGEHTIELIVNDSADDSEPNYVTIIVVPPVQADMKVTPQVLNLDSHGKWVKAHFVMPDGFSAEQIDTNAPAVFEPPGIESDLINAFINEEGLVKIKIAFDRSSFCAAPMDYGPVEVSVIGSLTTGRYFYGTDIIRIKTHDPRCIAFLASHWLDAGCGAPDWCGAFDLDHNSKVDFADYSIFADYWLH